MKAKAGSLPAFMVGLASIALPIGSAKTSSMADAPGLSGHPPAPHRIVETGPHHRVWQKVQTLANEPDGLPIVVTNSYVELATGLNRWEASRHQWLAAQAIFEPLPRGGFAARQTAHQVTLAADLNAPSAVEVVSPDGQRLRSTPLGIAALDMQSGLSVLLAEVKNCRAALISTNEVLYANAFDGLAADVRYRLTLAGLEQDVILREPIRPASLEALGLAPETSRLLILTEFFDAPNPARQRRLLEPPRPDADSALLVAGAAERAATADVRLVSSPSASLVDEELDFGSVRIGSGTAFQLSAESSEMAPPWGGVPIGKSWELLDGRRFLIESVDYRSLLPWLEHLSPSTNASARGPFPKPGRGSVVWRPLQDGLPGSGPMRTEAHARGELRLVLPRKRPQPTTARAVTAPKVQTESERSRRPTRPPRLTGAPASLPGPGVIIDYPMTLTGGKTNFTFRGDTTYYLSGPLILDGTNTTFEAGTVIKYAPAGAARLSVRTPVTWQGSLYRPVVLTARDDRSVGEAVAGGPLTGYYAGVALDLDGLSAASAFTLQHVRIVHAQTALAINGRSGHVLAHAQIVNCQRGLLLASAQLRVRNALFHNVLTNFCGYGATVAGEHLTIDTSAWLNASNACASLSLTNSLLVAVTNIGALTSTNRVGIVASPAGVFLRSLAGAHYLADNTWRDCGTTNLTPDLRAQLAAMTTFPPILLTNRCTTNTVLGPRALRDTDVPDLGYHYPPLDYACMSLEVTNATLVLTNGVCLGGYGPALLSLRGNARLVSEGNPLNLNRLVAYHTVQEQPEVWITNTANWTLFTGANVDLRFTEVPFLAAASSGRSLVPAGAFNGAVTLRDCQLRGACLNFYNQPAWGCYNPLLILVNNLLERCSFSLAQGATNSSPAVTFFSPVGALSVPGSSSFVPSYLYLTLRNNLFTASELNLAHYGSYYGSWDLYDNLFDQCAVSFAECDPSRSAGGPLTSCGWNAFIGTSSPFRQATDRTGLARDFVRGPLGDYYYPASGGSNSLATLINANTNRTADAVGLYHYTTIVTQEREGLSALDLGFHYLAVTNRNGVWQPLDSDGDGVPDYLEDRNGNGRADPGETPFSSVTVSVPAIVNYTEKQLLFVFDAPATRIAVLNPAPPDFLGGMLMVGVVTNAQPTDRLSFPGSPMLGVTVATNQVWYQGLPVGTVTGSGGGGPLVVAFNAQATTAAAIAALRSVAFGIASDRPVTAARTLRVVVTDGHGSVSRPAETTVTVTSVNDAPILTLNTNTLSFPRAGPPVYVAPDAVVVDVDTTNFAGAHLSVALSLNGQSEDRLTLPNQGNTSGQVGLNGTNVTCGGLTVGWFAGGVGVQPLVIGFNVKPATVGLDVVKTVLRAIQYQNLSESSSTFGKSIRLVVTDGEGGHAEATRPVRVVCPDRLDCVLVLDRSGSMNRPPNDPALPHLKAAAELFLSYLNPQLDQAGVVAFNQVATNLLPLTSGLEAARRAIDPLSADGDTRIDLGIATAQQELASNHHRPEALPVMILLTDGWQTGDNSAVQAAAADAKSRGTRLITIGLGDSVDTNLLRTIASGPAHFHFSPTAADLQSTYTGIAQGLCRAWNQPPRVVPGDPFALTFAGDEVTTNLHGWVTDDGLPATNRLVTLWSLADSPGSVRFHDPQATNTAVTFTRPPLSGDRPTDQPLVYTLSLTANDGEVCVSSNLTVVVYLDPAGNQAPYVDPGPPQSTITNLPIVLPGRVIDDGLPAGAALTARWTQVSGPAPVALANANSPVTTALFTCAGDYLLQLSASDTQLNATNTLPVTVCEGTGNPADILLLVDESGSMSSANKMVCVKAGARAFVDAVDLDRHAVAIVGFAETAIVHSTLTHDRAVLHPAIDQLEAHRQSTLAANTYMADGLEAAWDELRSPRHNSASWPLVVLLSDGLPSDDPTAIAQAAKRAGLTIASVGVALDDRGREILRALASSDSDCHFVTDPEQIKTMYLQIATSLCYHHNRRPMVDAGPDTLVNAGDTPTLTGQVCDDGPTNTLRLCWSRVSGSAPITFSPPDGPVTRLSGLTFPGTNVLRLTAFDGSASSSDDVSVIVNALPTVDAGPDRDLIFTPNLVVSLAGRASDPDAYPAATLSNCWTQLSGPTPATFLDGLGALSGRLRCPLPGTYVLRLDVSDGLAHASDQVTLNVRPPLEVNAGPDLVVTNFTGSVTVNLAGSIVNRAGAAYTRGWTRVSAPGTVLFGNATATNTTATLTVAGTYVLRLAATNALAYTNADEMCVFVGTSGNRPPAVNAGPDQTILSGSTALLSGSVSDDGKPKPACSVRWSQVDGPGLASFALPDAITTTATFSAPGRYVLRLTADDSQLTGRGEVAVQLNAPPVIDTRPALVVLKGQPITLQANVTDDGLPAGNNLAVRWTQLSGPGTVRLADSASPVTPATFDAQGLYTLQLSASDGQLTGKQIVTVTVLSPPIAHADEFTVETDPEAAAGECILEVLANDTDPEGDALCILEITTCESNDDDWYGTQGTVRILNQGRQICYTPDAGARGFGRFSYTISDGHHGQSTAEVWLAFRPRNRPPKANPDSFFVPAGSPLATELDVLSNDEDPDGDRLTVVSYTSPAHGVIESQIAPSSTTTAGGLVTHLFYRPEASFVGRDSFTYTANDPCGATSTAIVSVDVGLDPTANHAPAVFAGADRKATPSQGLDLAGQATDDGLPAGSLSFQWSLVSGPGSCQFADSTDPNSHIAFSTTGTYVLRLTASDGLAHTADDVLVTVVPDTLTPLAALLNLTNATTVATPIPTLTNSFFDLLGIAGAGRRGAPVSYRIDLFYPGDGTAAPAVVPNFAAVTASQPIDGGKLGTLDFTRVRNGVYDLVLTVQADGLTATAETRFALDCELKLGRLTFAEDDCTLPLPGLPLTIVRRYDSFNPTLGDFGYGWTCAFRDLEVCLDEERTPTFDEDPTDDNGQPFSRRTGGWRDVSLTLPDGRRATFTFSLRKGVASYYAQWATPPGVFATLEPTVSPQLVTLPALSSEEAIPPYWQAAGMETPYEAFDFPGFNLTLPDGSIYELRGPDLGEHILPDGTYVHAYGAPVLTRLLRPEGEAILVSSNRLDRLNPLGEITGSLCFDRVNGLIVAVRDPLSGPSGLPVVKYDYDARTNLSHVCRLLDRATGTYATNTYCYTNIAFPHYLTRMLNPTGVPILQNEYDAAGKLVAVTDALGNQTRFADETITDGDQTFRREIITDPLGRATTHYFDARGNLTRTIDPLGHIVLREFDADDRLRAESVPLTGTESVYPMTYYEYDAHGNRTATTDPLGNTTRLDYDPYGQITVATDPLGHTTQYQYDAAGRLLAAIDAAGSFTRFSYDNRGNLIATVDPLGLIVTNQYDAVGNLVATTSLAPDGTRLTSTTCTYDAIGNRTQQTLTRTLPDGRAESLVTRWLYDAQNRVVQTIAPDGAAQRVGYDLNGRQQYTVDALGRTNSFAYDARGLRTNHVHPDGLRGSFAYDAAGRRTNSTDRAGYSTALIYDALGRLLATIHPDRTSNLVAYTVVGQVEFTTDARGNLASFQYDAAGRRTGVIDALGNATQFAYDAGGNLTNVVDALAHATGCRYDALNRRTQTVFPDGTAELVDYDALGRRVARTDAANLTTRFGYDPLGRLSAVTNALLDVTRHACDEAGNHITQTDALGRITRFEYDTLGRRTKRTLPAGQFETFGYDLAGNRAARTNFNGEVLRFQYDALNRLTNKYWLNGAASNNLARYVYTPNSQIAQRLDPSGTYTWTYDNRVRVRTNTTPAGTLFYTYDADGNLARIRSSTTGGADVTYDWDPLNCLVSVADTGWSGIGNGTATCTYDNAGHLETVQYPNGLNHAYLCDPRDRPTNVTLAITGSSAPLATFNYTLSPGGNRLALAERVSAANRAYAWNYDALYRLSGETISGPAGPAGALAYRYDPVANRTNRTATGALAALLPTTTATFTANDWLTADTYDNDGNTVHSGAVACGYDVLDRLVAWTNSTTVVTFGYDDDGNRVQRAQGGTTTRYLVDSLNPTGYAQVLEESVAIGSGPATLSRVYTYGHDLLSVRDAAGPVHFYGYDAYGSVRLLTDPWGALTDTYTYDAWGTLVAESHTGPATPNNYLYCGEQLDPTLGLYYLRARSLNPATGRFWTADAFEGSVLDPLSLHPYLYAAGDPVNRTDPSGQFVSTAETVTAVSINAGLTMLVNGAIFYGAGQADRMLADATEKRAIQHFVTTHQGAAITQQEFNTLEIRSRWPRRAKPLYLHYSRREHAPSVLLGLWAPSWATRMVYGTGWAAKLELALPHREAPNAVFVVRPKARFEPTGPAPVAGKFDVEQRWMPGGGQEWIFRNGSGGPGTVFGPVPIPAGAQPSDL